MCSLPQPGIEPCNASAGGFFTAGPPGKSQNALLKDPLTPHPLHVRSCFGIATRSFSDLTLCRVWVSVFPHLYFTSGFLPPLMGVFSLVFRLGHGGRSSSSLSGGRDGRRSLQWNSFSADSSGEPSGPGWSTCSCAERRGYRTVSPGRRGRGGLPSPLLPGWSCINGR